MKNIRLLVLLIIVIPVTFACTKEEKEEDLPEESSLGSVVLLKENCTSPMWSFDGKKIAFIQDEILFVMNADGTGVKRLTSEFESETPRWCPSGAELAYIDKRNFRSSIYKINADDTKVTQITGTDVNAYSFSWSPDGQKIVYEESSIGLKRDLCVINKDGTGNTRLNITVDAFRPGFTPKGGRIMFYSGYDSDKDIYLMGTDGSNLQRLKIDDLWEEDAQMNNDETKIYFLGSPTWDIYVVDAEGANLVNLSKGAGVNHYMRLSPDGKYISFSSYRDENDGFYLMRTDGSGVARVTKGSYMSQTGSWSPDSRKLAFFDERNGVKGIFILTLRE
jgi:TolB protein